MLRARGVAIAVAIAFGANACGSGAGSTKVVSTREVCPAKPELDDKVDCTTGLAPIPRQVAGSHSKPSGNIYWRQMRAVSIVKLQHVEKLVVDGDKACAVAAEAKVFCWKLPFATGQVLVLEREPQQLVTELISSELDALSSSRPPVAREVQAALSSEADVAQIEAGSRLACARLATGQVRCLSTEKPRTPPSASDFPTTPTPVRDLAGNDIRAKAISVGGAACAVTQDDDIVCWGHIAQAAAFPACDGGQ